MSNIAVIGAGITGVTTAYELIKRGYTVTVFDKHRYAGMETSYANGGQLSACNAEVWNHPSTLLKGMRWMFQKGAPLLLNPKPSYHKYSWLAEFIANIPNYERNTIETVKLAIQARQHLFDIAEKENIDFNLERRGILHVYHNAKDFKHAGAVNDLLAKGGLDRHAVSVDEMQQIEPTLVGNYYGGYFTDSDSTGDIHKFTRGLAQACERLGVKFVYNCNIECIEKTNNIILSYRIDNEFINQQFDKIVICAGVGSRHLANQLGDYLNIYPVKGYSITVQLEDNLSKRSAPWVSLLDDSAKIVTSRLGKERLRVAGTAEFNGFNKDIRADRIKPLIDWTEKYFPNINTSRCIPWAGLRPMTPSMMPKVGPGKLEGVYYNSGHGHLGWTLSAATANIVAEFINEN